MKLLPNIENYLETTLGNNSITFEGLEDIIDKVTRDTKLSKDVVELIIKLYFNGIKQGILRGDIFHYRGFGNLFVSSPLNGNLKQIFIKFKNHKSLLRKLNGNKSNKY